VAQLTSPLLVGSLAQVETLEPALATSMAAVVGLGLVTIHYARRLGPLATGDSLPQGVEGA